MSITLNVTESYCSVTEAETYLENNSTWIAATEEAQIQALLAARYYIDITFTCDLTNYTVAPDALKMATAYLAADYIVDDTIFDSDIKIKELEVKAGDVSSRKTYLGSNSKKPSSLQMVKGILKDLCLFQGNLVNLGRG